MNHQPNTPINIQAKSQTILAVGALLGFAFYICFWNQGIGLSSLVYLAIVIAATWLITSRDFNNSWPKSVWMIIGIAAYLVFMLVWRASNFMAVLNLMVLFGLGLLTVWRLSKRSIFMPPQGYFLVAFLPLWWIVPFFQTLSQAITKPQAKISSASSIIRGLMIALPIAGVLLALFSRADPALGSFLNNIFNPLSLMQGGWFTIILMILFVAGFFAAAFSFIVRKGQSFAYSHQDKTIIGQTESQIVLTVINGVFLLYLLFQSVYLFGGQAYLESSAITYADYARSGFNELIWTALIAVGVLWLTKPHLASQGLKSWQARLGSSLIILVLVVLASAINRLWLYEQAYGFTVTRLLAYAFAAWLCSVLIIIFMQIVKQLPAIIVGPSLISSTVVIVIALNLLNPEAFIAQQNIQRYHQTGKIDLVHLASLSADATPALIPLLDDEDQLLAQSTAFYLQMDLNQYSSVKGKNQSSWQSWNWSRTQEQLLLNQQQLQVDPNFHPPTNSNWD